MEGFDENGWASDAVTAEPVADNWTLMSPDASSRMIEARWAHQARRFFSTTLTLRPTKHYPGNGWPLADRAIVELVAAGGERSQVALLTLPLVRAPLAMEAAKQAVAAIGGAGFDALLPRTQRVWQLAAEPRSGDARGPLLLGAIMASLLLAPLVPPAADSIFGVKGARERLQAAGLRS